MSGRRDIHISRVLIDGIPHRIKWIESRCGTYYYIIEEAPNFAFQLIQEAQWDLMHGRMTPLAQEIANNPLPLMKKR